MRIGNNICERVCYLGLNKGKGRGIRHPFSCVHTIIQTYTPAYKMTSHPSVLAEASDSKKPDPYYLDFCWFVSVCSLLVFLYLTLCMFYWNYCFSLCLPDVTVCFFFSKSASHFCISDWEKTVIRFVMMCSIKESSPSHFYDASSWHVSTQVHFEWRVTYWGFEGIPLRWTK